MRNDDGKSNTLGTVCAAKRAGRQAMNGLGVTGKTFQSREEVKETVFHGVPRALSGPTFP
jgi:hypothetical protein